MGGYPRNQICPQVMLRNIDSITGEIRESIISWTKDQDKLNPKCDAGITIERKDNRKITRRYNGCTPLSVCVEVCLELD